MLPDSPPSKVRIDRWLWAARFFKTRQLAASAIKAGHIALNGLRAKPARGVQKGDRLKIRKAGLDYELIVTALDEQRRSAAHAQTLYQETPLSLVARLESIEKRKLDAASLRFDRGKPDKRSRRLISRLRRGISDHSN